MISPEQLQTIADKINGQDLNETVVGALRGEYPGVHFTYCMDDDLPNNEPLFEGAGFNIYLVDGREHCLRLTESYDNASGIVIAEVIAE